MSFFYNIILNLILFLLPLSIYFIMKIYIKTEEKQQIYPFITFISILLLLIYSKIDFLEISIFLFLAYIINFIKNNKYILIIFSIFMIIINKLLFSFNIIFLILEYLVYYLVFIYYKKDQSLYIRINRIIIIRSFFLSLYIFYIYPNTKLSISIIYIFSSIAIYYGLIYITNYLLNQKINIRELTKLQKNINTQDNMHNYLCAVTHELKNSLSISKGYLDMMDKKKKNDYLKIIKKEINRSIEMIQDGLSLSKDKLKYEILDINVLLEDVSETIEELFKNKKIKYRVNYIDEDIYILGDYEKLKQVLINLLKNSVESKENNLKIEIDNHILRNEICISVKDNGCGIKDLEHIGKGYSSKCEGMGIGTTFSKNIIDKHSGKIIYETIQNEGTTVNIFLPLFK